MTAPIIGFCNASPLLSLDALCASGDILRLGEPPYDAALQAALPELNIDRAAEVGSKAAPDQTHTEAVRFRRSDGRATSLLPKQLELFFARRP